MNLPERIRIFHALGEKLINDSTPGLDTRLNNIIEDAHNQNPWFTPENVRYAINEIAKSWLSESVLNEWVNSYEKNHFNTESPKTIGVIMAGNIPLVGFHDLICILITGNRFLGKISSKDGNLMLYIINLLKEINPDLVDQISITEESLHNFQAIIATGSNNSAKYFEFYFKKYPSIIRKQRNSVAVLTGRETADDYRKLGDDIFTYFGLGCRNVSKIFVPQQFDFRPMIDEFQRWQGVSNNSKYANNYEYHRALFLMNGINHFDNGFLLIRSEEMIGSPVAVLHYQEYQNIDEVKSLLLFHKDEIQCIVSNEGIVDGSIAFGDSQKPAISDYADGVDTIKFLAELM